ASRHVPVRMIEGVEVFGAELHAPILTQPEVLKDGHVPDVVSRADDRGPASAAEAIRWGHKTALPKRAVDGVLEIRRIRTAHVVRTDGSIGAYTERIASTTDCNRIAGLERGNPVHLPATDRVLHEGVQVATSERQLVEK